jgi:hypothetical protein
MITKEYIDENAQFVFDESFGTWMQFWHGGDDFTFRENKEIFFLTLKKLLNDNKVVLFAPYSMFNESTNQWDKTVTIRKYGDTIWGLPSKEKDSYSESCYFIKRGTKTE